VKINKSEVLEIFLEFMVLAIVVVIIRSFFIAPYVVSGSSMDETFADRDYLIGNKISFFDFFGSTIEDPERGDVIIFYPPNSKEKYFIKRVIGVYGDTVEIDNGEVFIIDEDGEKLKLPEKYLSEKNQGRTMLKPTTKENKFKVPKGKFFVMGDNRTNSKDSRDCFDLCSKTNKSYFVNKEDIKAKAFFILFNWNFELGNFGFVENGSSAYAK